MKNVLGKKLKLWVVLVECLIAGISIVMDYFFNITMEKIETVSSTLFGLLPIAAGFTISAYLLFVELYKDRYSYKFIKGKVFYKIIRDLISIATSVVIGIITIALGFGLIVNCAFIFCAILSTVVTVWDLFYVCKSMTISAYVKDYCSRLTKSLSNKSNTIEQKDFNDLYRLLEECIAREEYLVAKQMSDESGKIFRSFLENSISIISNGEDGKKINESFERIAKFGMRQLELCDSTDAEMLIHDISGQQYENLYFCIKTNQYEWFSKYLDEMTTQFYWATVNKRIRIVEMIHSIFCCVLEKTIEDEKNDWSRLLVEKVSDAVFAAGSVSDSDLAEHYIKFIILGLENTKDNELYELMFARLKEYTFMLNHYGNPAKEYIRIYSYYFNRICKDGDCEKIEHFIQMIFETSIQNNSDSIWAEFKVYCINQMEEAKLDKEKIDKYQMKLLSQIIDMREAYIGGLRLPDYKTTIYDGLYSSERVQRVCDEVRELLNRAILRENLVFFYRLLQEWTDCICYSQKNQKDIQVDMFEIYIWLVDRTRNISNRQFSEVAFGLMHEAIRKLDDSSSISDSFGDRIIDGITNLARSMDSEAHVVLLRSIDTLSSFVDDRESVDKIVYRFSTSKEKRRKIGKGLYNIAVNCIENDYEEGLRKASNAIGWFIVSCIKSGNTELTKYLINLSGHMYNIACDMNVSKKTMTFIATLFTTVGTYCVTEDSNKAYLPYIFDNMRRISEKDVRTAIDMRIYENDMFQDFFKNKAEYYSNDFLKRFLGELAKRKTN